MKAKSDRITSCSGDIGDMKNLKLLCLSILSVSLIIITFFLSSISIAQHKNKQTITDAINAVNNKNTNAITVLINDITLDPRFMDFRNHIILIMAADSGQKPIVQLLLNSENIHLKEYDPPSGINISNL